MGTIRNVRAAKALGWKSCVHYFEPDPAVHSPAHKAAQVMASGGGSGADATIQSLEELRGVWPHLFKDSSESTT